MSVTEFADKCEIKRVNKIRTKDKNSWYLMIMTDRPEFTTAMVWNYEQGMMDIMAGDTWLLAGELKSWRDKVSLHVCVEASRKLSSSVLKDHATYLTPDEITHREKYLAKTIEELENESLREIVKLALQLTYERATAFGQPLDNPNNAPGSTSHHHCYRGGYLDHVTEMLEIAKRLLSMPQYTIINKDVVLAGIICHDLGKLLTYYIDSSGQPAKRTYLDLAYGHIAIGFEMFVQAVSCYCGTPSDSVDEISRLVANIKHIILSHHGTREWGSSIAPLSLEAHFVHMVDMMSAQMSFALLSAGKSPFHSDKFEDFSTMTKSGDGRNQPIQLGQHAKYYTHEQFADLESSRASRT